MISLRYHYRSCCAVCWPIAVLLSIMVHVSHAEAVCDSRDIRISGNLNASSSLAAQIPQQGTSLADFEVGADLHFPVIVLDGSEQTHYVYFYFYHQQARRWVVQAVVDGAEVGEANPVLYSMDTLEFDEAGQATGSRNGMTFMVPWANDPPPTVLTVYLNVTHFSRSSGFSSVSQKPCIEGTSSAAGVDFDNDGRTDFAIFRPEFGLWAILHAAGASSSQQVVFWKQWGLPGDYPIPGDYTGDGKADLAVWRPSNGNWYICPSDNNFDCTQGTVQQFGLPGDRPIAGDFDGDTIFDLAIWRPSFGLFIYKSSALGEPGEPVVRQWGLPSDIPLGSGNNR